MEFRGEKTYLFLSTGITTTVRTDAIDYRNMGLKRPDFPYGFSTDGITVHKIEQVEVKTGPSQEELKAQWDSAAQTAVAVRPAGSVGKGQTVHIVQKGPFSTTVIVRDKRTNSYRRIVLSDEMFQENFELTTQKVAARTKIKKPEPTEEPKEPEPVQVVSLPAKKIAPVEKRSPASPWIPLGMSFGLLALGFASTIFLSKQGRSGRPFSIPRVYKR